ncbi:MAG: response regulator [Gammaproteobacteria bacterium]|nr:response regulator [Gammaproteobacteria bacterium]
MTLTAEKLRSHSPGHKDGGGNGTNPAGQRKRPVRVLVLDDQYTGRKILEELVSSVEPGVTVKSFSNPYEALEDATQHVPDLVLTDYKMPIMDGVEFTRRFRQIGACADVPLVVVTVVSERRVRYQALEAGATDFLTRPVDHHECQARCRNLITLRRQQMIIRDRAAWLEQQVAVATRQIRTREEETLLRLAKAGEYRDEGTGNHILRIARYSRLLAEELHLSAAEVDEIELAAPMHDIGKIGIPDAVLLKPGRLTPEERAVMETHAQIGYEILKDSPSVYLRQGAIIALGHHENYDGSGYPGGLEGAEIPVAARIVAVADVFDALVSERPYKRAWPFDEALGFIKQQSGSKFDPAVAEAFLWRQDSVRDIFERLSDSDLKDQGRD